MEIILVLILIAIYFLPWIIALNRNREPVGIFLLNLFLGWTLVGWVGALVWAASGQSKPQSTAANNYDPDHPRAPNPFSDAKTSHHETKTPKPRTETANLDGQGKRISGRLFRKAAGLGLSVGSGTDEGDGNTSFGMPTEPATAHLSYVDANGNPSQRLVTLRRISPPAYGARTLVAYCHMRAAPRTFKSDRIVNLVDVTTGEVLETPENIEKWLRERTTADLSAALDGLTVLCFIAAADDHISDEEVSIMARFTANAAPGVLVPPDFGQRLARFAPTPEAVLKALLEVVARRQQRLLETAIEEVVNCDNHLHPAEIEALQFLRMEINTK